jgi:hypothetical protein
MYESSSSYSNDRRWRELDNWDSCEAILLFYPIPGKSVKQCLCDKDRLLQDIIEDAIESSGQ